MNILLKRTLSGIIFIALVTVALFLSEYTMLILMLAVFSLSFIEFQRMFRIQVTVAFITNLIAGQFLLVCAYLYFSGMTGVSVLGFAVIGFFTTLVLLSVFGRISFSDLSILSVGMLWVAGSSIFFIATGWIGDSGLYDPVFPMVLLVLVWIYDIAAYLVGSRIGKKQLASGISPGKTWEGFIGGILITSLAGWGVYRLTELYHPLLWVFIGAIISLSATVGDLFESKLKREAGVKDSGTIMPGHGGMLDRFDSTFFSAPVYFLILITWKLLS